MHDMAAWEAVSANNPFRMRSSSRDRNESRANEPRTRMSKHTCFSGYHLVLSKSSGLFLSLFE